MKIIIILVSTTITTSSIIGALSNIKLPSIPQSEVNTEVVRVNTQVVRVNTDALKVNTDVKQPNDDYKNKQRLKAKNDIKDTQNPIEIKKEHKSSFVNNLEQIINNNIEGYTVDGQSSVHRKKLIVKIIGYFLLILTFSLLLLILIQAFNVFSNLIMQYKNNRHILRKPNYGVWERIGNGKDLIVNQTKKYQNILP